MVGHLVAASRGGADDAGVVAVRTYPPGADRTGDRAASPPQVKPAIRIIDVAAREYHMPTGRPAMPSVVNAGVRDTYVDRRFDRPPAIATQPIRDPQADSVRALLRDRLARRASTLNARVELRLSGDVGLDGGLKRVVETLLHN